MSNRPWVAPLIQIISYAVGCLIGTWIYRKIKNRKAKKNPNKGA